MDLQKLGKYEIASKIGEGAMGEVYKAFDPILGREVAVKTMSAAIGADDELRQRFHREAQSAARLNHPNIITIHDFGEDQGRAYIAMELLEGDDLKDLIARNASLTLEQKVALMEQMADGLAFAHARGVVHRDLKPANIRIHHGGQVKIMDFGLARLSTSNMTRAGMVMGTPNYMSPEQVRGERATARSDVFSLGAVFYELLTYRKPFDSDSLHAVLFQVMQQEPPLLADVVPGLPTVLCEVVQRAMAKDPARRFEDASELRENLRAVRATLSSSTASGLRAEPATLPQAARPPASMSAGAATRAVGATAVAAEVEEEPAHLVEPETIAQHQATTLAGRGATLAPSARRPKSEVGSGRASTQPSRLPWVGAAVVVALGLGYLTLRLSQDAPVSPPASPAPSLRSVAPGVGSVRAEGSVALSGGDRSQVLENARRSLVAKDYRAAVAQVEPVLARAPEDADARRLASEAQAALRRGEAAARDLDAALDAGNAGAASTALARLTALDPRHPDLAALTLRLNDALRREATDAQRALEQARRQPPPTTPATTVVAAPPVTAAPVTAPPAPPPTTVAPPTTQAAAPAPAALTPAQLEAARKTIRGVLGEYESALESRNAEYLRRLAPGLDYEAMKASLAAVAGMDVKIEIRDVAVVGDTATADCLVTYTPNPKPVGKIKPVPTLFRLKQSGAVWVIENVQRR
jgi:eukaryotic-like serine/threonine-protein kinase